MIVETRNYFFIFSFLKWLNFIIGLARLLANYFWNWCPLLLTIRILLLNRVLFTKYRLHLHFLLLHLPLMFELLCQWVLTLALHILIWILITDSHLIFHFSFFLYLLLLLLICRNLIILLQLWLNNIILDIYFIRFLIIRNWRRWLIL